MYLAGASTSGMHWACLWQSRRLHAQREKRGRGEGGGGGWVEGIKHMAKWVKEPAPKAGSMFTLLRDTFCTGCVVPSFAPVHPSQGWRKGRMNATCCLSPTSAIAATCRQHCNINCS